MQTPTSFYKLKLLDFDDKSKLWAKYSIEPYKQQIKALWYYIQCQNLDIKLDKKYKTKLNKYMKHPEKSIEKSRKNKYRIHIGTELIRIYKDTKHIVTAGENNTFLYKEKTYKTLTEVASHIYGKHISGPHFFGLDKKNL